MALAPSDLRTEEEHLVSARVLEEIIDTELKKIRVDRNNPVASFVLVGNYPPSAVEEVQQRYIDAGWTGAKLTVIKSRSPNSKAHIQVYLTVLPTAPKR